MHGHMGGFMGGGFMWILWIAVIAIVVVGAYRLWKPGRPGSSAGRDESPETILKQRYARGEIGKEQYEKTLADLRR